MTHKDVSRQTRVEVTKHYATKYAKASKKAKGRILGTVVELPGWNRDHARQQLKRRLDQPKERATATVAVIDRRKTKGANTPMMPSRSCNTSGRFLVGSRAYRACCMNR